VANYLIHNHGPVLCSVTVVRSRTCALFGCEGGVLRASRVDNLIPLSGFPQIEILHAIFSLSVQVSFFASHTGCQVFVDAQRGRDAK
jgi:hypothetical protein